MSKTKRELAIGIYETLNGQQYFMQVQGLVGCEIGEFRRRVIADIEAELSEPDADPYLLGLHNSEVHDFIDEKFASEIRIRFKDGDMQTVLNHVFHKFDWQHVYEQIENIAGEFIADLKTQTGRD